MKKIFVVLIFFGIVASASDLKVAAGAGYKKPLMDVIKEYQKSGATIEPFFGNMRQVTTQAKQTDIAIIVGDKNFLSKKSKLPFSKYTSLGRGKVVVAYPKGKDLDSIEMLDNGKIQKISMPQPKKAIYGIAGLEFLKNSGLYQNVEKKLHIVATVPQSMTYVITGEVDAGIVNLTAALANKEKIGGYIEVDPKYYSSIEIVAGELSACNSKKCYDFLDFLQSKMAQNIFKKYGL
jgi:molybdate transport system substrate-binding protein